MQAFNEALNILAPKAVVHFGTKITNINVEKNEILTEMDNYAFDLIIGADGAGSIVRKAMLDYDPTINCIHYRGEDYAKSIYLD